MLAAVRARPPLMTAGKARPTRPVASGSFAASAAMVGIIASGLEGWGVGAEMISPTRRSASTSTTPALMKEPPTSMPRSLRVIALFRSEVGGGRELHVALAPPLSMAHPHGGGHRSARHHRHHQGGERVHVRAHAEPHLGEDD